MPSLAVESPSFTMVDLEDKNSIENPQVKRRRYDVDVDVAENQIHSTDRCIDNLLTSPSPVSSQADSIDSSPSSHHSSKIPDQLTTANSISPNGVSCPMATTDVVNGTVYSTSVNSPIDPIQVSWMSTNGDSKNERANLLTTSSSNVHSPVHNEDTINTTTAEHNSPDTLYTHSTDALTSYHSTSDYITKTNVSDYQNSSQFAASFCNNQMQVYQTVGNSQTAPYSMNTANAAGTGYYNGQNGQTSPGYGVLSNAYAMSGSRMLNQSGKSTQGLTAQSGYLNPYSTFGSTTGGQVSGQTTPSYTAYGAGYNAMTGSSYPGAPMPNTQTFNTAQQGLDYSTFGSFGQTGGYSYPCYPGQGYSTPYVAGGTATIQPTSTSATYQLSHIPPSIGDALATTETHHHYSLEDDPSPPIKTDNVKSIQKKRVGRGPGRKQSNPSPEPENQLERVYLWDLDETLIIFHSLLTGTYATKYGKDERFSTTLGCRMEEMIFSLADTNFFFNDLEVGRPECDQTHIDDVASEDNGQDLTNYNFQADGFHAAARDGSFYLGTAVRGGVDCNRKLAFRYRKIKEIYNKYRGNIAGLLGPAKKQEWLQLRSEIESITDNWATLALKCLNIINNRPTCVNVLVTTSQLVPAICKVLLYDLGSAFPIENIYSATKLGKEECFQKIKLRFGKCTYVALGDSDDERTAAKHLDFPFWPISTHSDFAALHDALIKEHM